MKVTLLSRTSRQRLDEMLNDVDESSKEQVGIKLNDLSLNSKSECKDSEEEDRRVNPFLHSVIFHSSDNKKNENDKGYNIDFKNLENLNKSDKVFQNDSSSLNSTSNSNKIFNLEEVVKTVPSLIKNNDA